MNISLCDVCGLLIRGNERYRPTISDLDLCLDCAGDFNIFVLEKVQELRKKHGYKPPLVEQEGDNRLKVKYQPEPVKLPSPTSQEHRDDA